MIEERILKVSSGHSIESSLQVSVAISKQQGWHSAIIW